MDMLISGQEIDGSIKHARGPRARMYKLMLETAVTIANTGRIPSVSEVAEACEVSRATAYRYFPTQASLVKAIVVEALGPILEWSSKSDDALERIDDLPGGTRLEKTVPELLLVHEPGDAAQQLDVRADEVVLPDEEEHEPDGPFVEGLVVDRVRGDAERGDGDRPRHRKSRAARHGADRTSTR